MFQVYNKNLINVDGSNISLQLRKRRESARHMRSASSIICANVVLKISIGNIKEENLTFVTFSRTGTRCLLTTQEGATRPQQVLKKIHLLIFWPLSDWELNWLGFEMRPGGTEPWRLPPENAIPGTGCIILKVVKARKSMKNGPAAVICIPIVWNSW